MNKRPLSITIIAWLFIASGIVGLTYHSTKLFDADNPVQPELILILALRVLVIVCGVFILRGSNWARWLLLVWIAYHVVLSAFHAWPEFAMHSALLVIVSYFLLGPTASAYFTGSKETTNEN